MVAKIVGGGKPDATAKAVPPPEDLVMAVIDAYPKLARWDPKAASTPYVCAGALWSDDGEHSLICAPYVCHQFLRYKVDPGLYDNLVTSYPDPQMEWFDFIKNRMFRKWADKIELRLAPDDEHYYIHIKDLANFPANALLNFCIMTRHAWEVPTFIKKWNELVSEGYDPAFAYGCMVMPQVMGNPRQGHQSIDNTSSLELIVRGEPINLAKGFKDHPGAVIPCNHIWGTSTDLRTLEKVKLPTFWQDWKAKHANIL